ncbi:flavin-dependent oxidoreductase [Mesorhizobium sp. WSM2239]|uniref:Flavin-dependent oxidoreductase n=2 Tax=unclassified Mesorhizobium TaxID=325217 RepID=A0AAU8DBD4_9HYPH
MKALIVGAGIGGLTSALFLHRVGIEVEIFEQTEAVRELGVGINMLPHAARELAALGLLEELDQTGIRTGELIYANRFGQTIWQEPRGVAAGYTFPQFSIHRGRLLGLLHRTAKVRLGRDALRTDRRLTGFEQRGDRVVARFKDRSGALHEAEGDLLVGADGIHSRVRAILYPHEGPPVWSGIMLWRGMTEWPVWRDGRTMLIAGGNAAKFVFYPIASTPSAPERRLTNWAIMARIAEHAAAPPRREDWNRPGVLDDVLPFVRDRFRLDFLDPVALVESTATFYEYPNCDRDPVARWSFGRVTLLGDAAHPMYPVGSNGASQAILDAKSLAGHLDTHAGVEAALSAYDAERRPATAEIVIANRKGGPERVIDTVEARAPHGFDDIEAIAGYEERQAIVRGYATLAGYSRSQVNRATGLDDRTLPGREGGTHEKRTTP